jgi:hypothetical protein
MRKVALPSTIITRIYNRRQPTLVEADEVAVGVVKFNNGMGIGADTVVAGCEEEDQFASCLVLVIDTLR